MRRYRALALLASLVAMVATSAGVTLLTPGSSSASTKPQWSATGNGHGQNPGHGYGNGHRYGKRHGHRAPANLLVSRETVRAGATVKVVGVNYGKREKVRVTIRFTQRGAHRAKIARSTLVQTNAKGSFILAARMSFPGKALIKARGLESGKVAAETVRIRKVGRGFGHSVIPGHFGDKGGRSWDKGGKSWEKSGKSWDKGGHSDNDKGGKSDRKGGKSWDKGGYSDDDKSGKSNDKGGSKPHEKSDTKAVVAAS